jgi:transcriptional regulator with XRE-family HTH domain
MQLKTGGKGRVRQTIGRYRFDSQGVMRVGEILRNAREVKGWSLQELQAYCGLPASTANGIENGFVTKIQADTLETLRVALEPQNPETGEVYTLGELYGLMLVREEDSNTTKGKK